MSRLYRAGDAYVKTFTVSSSTGAAANADSTPTGTIYRNGAADATPTVTVTNPATGVYKAAATIPGGYSAGDVVELLVAATVGGVATKAIVDSVHLVAVDPTDAAGFGLSRIDAAVTSRASSAALATVQADTDDIQTRIPAALVSGRIDASVGAMAANTLTASALAADAVDEILDDAIGDGTITMRQAMRVLIAGMAAKLSGAATTTVTIRNLADTADVIVATVDSNGNRSAVTVTP